MEFIKRQMEKYLLYSSIIIVVIMVVKAGQSGGHTIKYSEHKLEPDHECSAVDCEAISEYKALCKVRVKDDKGEGYQDIEADVWFCKAHWETQIEYNKRIKEVMN